MATTVNRTLIPSAESVVFQNSSFFHFHVRLPTPQEVRAAVPAGALSNSPQIATRVQFPHLNLFVKYGPYVQISEGQCLHVVHRLLPSTVPVPEVFGWCKDGVDTFLYMQLVPGITLDDRWISLKVEEKQAVCENLRRIIGNLRSLQQDPTDVFIGSVGGQPLPDNLFQELMNGQRAGPFRSVKDFHDWFTSINLDPGIIHCERDLLKDNNRVVFTHADIHRDNVIVSPTGPPRILAIVDWGQSGWYPDYWEYCKSRSICRPHDEWETTYLPRIFGGELEEWYWDWYFFIQRIGF
ncbi:phosphotransferase enzyme family protein-like protein [Zopfia rhizophila CBS 207.26]|uniref:Phosphotransferase enzyme family protein-like protein n=1 Tax=Zopfia rhizophila CBS 207.26 TaxID=1314779 RepID=A0A6A6DVR3_9PEZI|nr:phosphotransferase enzyme family protein-like protein [Zopfia rhizophila CBS 207.26]